MTNKIITWILFFLCTVAASSITMVWSVGVDSWYKSLINPYSPAPWIFGPVWTTLYILIATSAYRVMYASQSEYKAMAMALWSLQMVLNALWTPIFFGAHNILIALIFIVFLWITVFAYLYRSWFIDKISSIILWPYLAWLSFATFLNFTIWKLN